MPNYAFLIILGKKEKRVYVSLKTMIDEKTIKSIVKRMVDCFESVPYGIFVNVAMVFYMP